MFPFSAMFYYIGGQGHVGYVQAEVQHMSHIRWESSIGARDND